jgi:hypothetical protein
MSSAFRLVMILALFIVLRLIAVFDIAKSRAHESVVMEKGYQDVNEPRFLSPFKDYANQPLTQDQLEFNSLIHLRRHIQWRHSIDFHEKCFIVACKLTNIFLEFEPINKT